MNFAKVTLTVSLAESLTGEVASAQGGLPGAWGRIGCPTMLGVIQMNQVRGRSRALRNAGISVAIVVVSALLATGVGTGTAGASATTCTKPAGAFATFHATFSNGTLKMGSATGSGLAAQACGSISIVNGQFISTVQPADIAFSPATVKILFLSLPTTVTVNGPMTGPAKIGAGFTSADINLTANITASASLLGFNCGIGPLAPTLTTGKSGSLTGKTFTGSLAAGFSGTVVANDFPVPAIKKSKTCPGLIAFLSNTLVGLPAAAGKASISMDGTIKIG